MSGGSTVKRRAEQRPFDAHIDVHIFGQRPGSSYRLSTAGADLVGPLVPQLSPGSCEDSRPVNHPVAIDDGDAARGHQGWRAVT